MSVDAVQPPDNGPFAVVRNALAWCREQIALAVPPGLRDALESGVSVVAIDLEDGDVVLRRFAHGERSEIRRIPRAQFDAPALAAALAPFLGRGRLLGDSFALRLPASFALSRRLSLPVGARSNIGTLLDLELDRQSPLDKSEVYHDYRILNVDRAAGRMDVEWRIVRRSAVSQAVEICRKAGVDLAVIAFVGDSEPSDGGSLPVDPAASSMLRVKRHLVSGLLALILVLALAATGGFYWRNEQAAADLFAQVGQARLAADESLRLEHDIAAMQRHARQLRQEKLRPTASRAIAEVTRILPDGTWVTAFAFRNGEVQVHGYSNAASSLIALFDASPLFASAEFRAPITQATSPGLQQFDLAAKIGRCAMSEPRWSGLRLGILIVAALLVVLAVTLPIEQLFAQQSEGIAVERGLLAKYRGDIAARSELRAQLGSLRQQESSTTTLLDGDSTSLAAASMQGLVKTLVERHAGQLRSAQMLSASAAKGLEKVVVQYDVSIPLGGLKAVTYELETGSPFLFVDDMDIRPDTFAGGETAAPANLHVQWTVHGYRRVEAP